MGGWGWGDVLVVCVCVSVSGVFSVVLCRCVCDLLIFLHGETIATHMASRISSRCSNENDASSMVTAGATASTTKGNSRPF